MNYMLFTFDRYEAGGGFYDFRGLFKTIDKAREIADKDDEFVYYQIVRKEDLAIVEERFSGEVSTKVQIPVFNEDGKLMDCKYETPG